MTTALFHSWYCAVFSNENASFGPSPNVRSRASVRAPSPPPARPAPLAGVTFELVERVRAGDVRAFDTMVREALEPLVKFAYGFVRTSDAAEDVVQDVLARVWHLGDAWRPPSPAAYLYAAVRNEALKVIRHRGVEARHVDRMQHNWAPDETTHRLLGPDELVLWQERMQVFESVLDSLTERQRTAFVLRYEQEMTVPAIALVLNISTKGAEKLVSRVTHLLRERLVSIR